MSTITPEDHPLADAVRRDLGDLFARYAWLAEKPARRPARALAA